MKKRGHTLLEILVAMVLFSLASMMIFVMFARGSRWFLDLRGRQDLHQDALVALQQVARHLRHSRGGSLTGVYLSPDHLALGMPTALDAQGVFQIDPATAEPLYQGNWICFFAGDSLQEKYLAATPSLASAPMTAAALTAAASNGHALARGVTAFRLLRLDTGAPTNLVTNPLRLELVMDKEKVEIVVRTVL